MLGDECNCMQRDKFTREIFDPFQNVLEMNKQEQNVFYSRPFS